MRRGVSSILTICLLLLTMFTPGTRTDATTRGAYERAADVNSSASPAADAMSVSTVQSQATTTRACLPHYGAPQFLLTARNADSYEPELSTADVNGDGLDDLIIRRSRFGTTTTFPLEILLNDGNGGLTVATSSIFSGPVPQVQAPTPPVVADLNGDGFPDLFVADFGMDAYPFPGRQNTLALSTASGKLVDATANLPQRNDNTNQACAADIDGDEDIDLYIENGWGQNFIDPYVLLNDGSGKFSVGLNRLPPLVDLDQNGYTACEFSDVNNDGSPDLILGDHGDDITNEHSTPDSEVLLNDGTGVFTRLPGALPPKPFAPTDMAQDIQSVDLNEDGYQDLLILYTKYNYVGRYIQILINNQDGSFRDETSTRLPQSDNNAPYTYQLQLMDIDRDGDTDLIARVWGAPGPDPLLFLNDGSGSFSLHPFDFGLWSLYYTFLDLDGDNGHDLVFVTFPPPEDIYVIRDLGCPMFLPVICRNYAAGN